MSQSEFFQWTEGELSEELNARREQIDAKIRAVKSDLQAVMLSLWSEELQANPFQSPLRLLSPEEIWAELLKRDETGTRERYAEALAERDQLNRAEAHAAGFSPDAVGKPMRPERFG